MFDVIVCGAGPAGSMAALVLARGGARVLLVDRARFPRDKLCGDTINPGAVSRLRAHGLMDAIELHASPIDGMIVTGERGVRITAPYGTGVQGRAVLRRDLDHALLTAAAHAGARVQEGVLVRAPLTETIGGSMRVCGVVLAGRDGRDLRVPAPLVIAADGRRSRLGIALGLVRQPRSPRRWVVGGYFEGVTGLTRFGEMHVREGHYIGVAPVPGGAANVCYVSASREPFRDPASTLTHALRADVVLGPRAASARLVTRPVALGPLAVDALAAGIPGLLLAGDAAGFIDPMTGDGLRFAIQGGELAGRAALAALADGQAAHHRLARWRSRAFGRKYRLNRTLRALVARPGAVAGASHVARVAPWLLQRVVAAAGDVSL